MKRKSNAIVRRKAMYGRMFVFPWVIGFLFFFLVPLGQSIQYSFSKVSKADGRAVVTFVGLDNYRFVWTESLDYRTRLQDSLTSFLPQLAIIVILSLILALILNQKFRGRLAARAVFFLPVIIAAGVVMQILNQDVLATQVRSGVEGANSYMFGAMNFGAILEGLGLPDNVVELLMGYLQDIFHLVWSCGVQIILFIAALQAVPEQLYEVSRVEGATAWENFWFITLPMIGNILVVVIVYTVIDLFTNADNQMMNFIYNLQKVSLNYDVSSAILWSYFLLVGVITAILLFVVNRLLKTQWEE